MLIARYAGNNEGVKAITSVVHGNPSKEWANNSDAQVLLLAFYYMLLIMDVFILGKFLLLLLLLVSYERTLQLASSNE